MMQRTDSGLLVPRQRGIVVPGRDFPHPREKRRASYISSGWNKRNFNLNYGSVDSGGVVALETFDPYYDQVSVLATFLGASGDFTFTDAGPLGSTIVRTAGSSTILTTGNPPYGSWWKGASGSLLNITLGAAGSMSGDFTLEYMTQDANNNVVFATPNAGYAYNNFYTGYGGPNLPYTSFGMNFPNQKGHVAMARSGSTLKSFLCGIEIGSVTYSGTIDLTSIQIGRFIPNNNLYFTGYMSMFRVTKGVARYTSNFLPPTKQLPTQLGDVAPLDSDCLFTTTDSAGTGLAQSSLAFSNQAIIWTANGANQTIGYRTTKPITKKTYCEFITIYPSITANEAGFSYGISRTATTPGAVGNCVIASLFGAGQSGYFNDSAIGTNNPAYRTEAGDIVGVAFDPATGGLWFSRNGQWISGDPGAGTSPTMIVSDPGPWRFFAGVNNRGSQLNSPLRLCISPSLGTQQNSPPAGFSRYQET